jgi:phosphate uptake regulator
MPERAKHISTSVDAALYGLKNDVLMMSSLTDRIFQTAFEALLNRDSKLCDHVVAEDEEIDILEKQVDQEGLSRETIEWRKPSKPLWKQPGPDAAATGRKDAC